MLTTLRRYRWRPARRLPIVLTRTVNCTTCGAPAHIRCTNFATGGYQDANHASRIKAAGVRYGRRRVA